MPTLYRADHVGSLLRPPGVLQAHADFAEQRIPLAQLRQVEDAAILQALDMQKQAGLGIFSDGEYRRSNWAGDFSESVDGYVNGPMPISFNWQLPDAVKSGASSVAEAMRVMPQQSGRVVGEKLRQKGRLTTHESSFLKQHAPGPFKITFPAPSYVVARGWSPGVSDKVYASRKDLLLDVAAMLRAEVQALVAEGVPYLQMDNPHYPDYIPEDRRAQWRALGIDPDQALRDDVEADTSVFAGVDRQRFTVATHICRGNGRSAWHTQGGYEPIAEQIFGRLGLDTFLLEYDSDRAGGFEPLRYMPAGKTVVLGLVTTKVGVLEEQSVLLERIDEAAKYVPLEQLALSPQCGFASMAEGNLLSWDEQRQKLDLVVDTARKVWG